MKRRRKLRPLRGHARVEHPQRRGIGCLITSNGRPGSTLSMFDVKQCLMQVCRPASKWFEPDTMRFFKSRVGGTAYYDGKGGAYFVSSEQHRGPRGYTVRHYSSCNVETVGDLMAYGSAAQAATAAKKFARMWGGARRK